MRPVIICLLSFLTLAIQYTAAGQSPRQRVTLFTEKADAYMRRLMAAVPELPGVVWVVVKDDKPVWVKAYGWADHERHIKADENTLFYIASATKSFTAMAAALLDAQGKIRLDGRIGKYIPAITFKDRVPADKITVRNLLTHTSGLQNDALTFRMAYSGTVDSREMAQVVANATRYIDSNYLHYHYDNLGYNFYTVLLKEFMGMEWQQLVQQQILTPLGMRHSTAYLSQAKKQGRKIAAPYMLYGPDGLKRSPLEKTDNNLQSAGGLFLTANDAATWLLVNINKGKLNGRQVIPAPVMAACHQGYTVTQRDIAPFTGKGSYGLGWQIGEYKGDPVHYHFGGFPGYRSHISFMPEQRIGVAVFVNESGLGGQIASLLATFAYDWWTGSDKQFDSSYTRQLQDLVTRHEKNRQRYDQDYKARAARKLLLSQPLAAYAGKFVHPDYGTLEISVAGNALTVRIGLAHCVSTPYPANETIRVELIPGTGQPIQFRPGANGEILSAVYDGAEFIKV